MGFASSEKHAEAALQPNTIRPGAHDTQSQFRAIDAATRLYAAAEQEHRRHRFDLAVRRALAPLARRFPNL